MTDITELVLIGVVILLPLIAQAKIKSSYNKYAKVLSSKGKTNNPTRIIKKKIFLKKI